MLSGDKAWDNAGKVKPAKKMMNRYLRIDKYPYYLRLL